MNGGIEPRFDETPKKKQESHWLPCFSYFLCPLVFAQLTLITVSVAAEEVTDRLPIFTMQRYL